MTGMTISSDHIPSDAKIINGHFGKVAIWGSDRNYQAAAINSKGRVTAQTYGQSEGGALMSLYIDLRPYRSTAKADGDLCEQMQIQAARDLSLKEAYICGKLVQITA